MEAEAAAPLSPISAVGGAPLWRLGERRARKPASANIFGGVALWQLQKLFQAAGDQDAEHRAQLVWGHGGEGELAQALIGLRARGRRRGIRTQRRDSQMGSRWLKAFHHMRIREASPNSHGAGSNEDSNNNNNSNNHDDHINHDDGGGGGGGGDDNDASDTETPAGLESGTRTPAPKDSGAAASPPQSRGPVVPSERPSRAGAGLRRGPDSGPERYLHHVIH